MSEPQRIVVEVALPDSELERIALRVAELLRGQQAADEAALTPKAAAAFISCSTANLAALRVSGRGPRYTKLSGRHVRYFRSDLIAWLRSNARTNTASNSAKERTR